MGKWSIIWRMAVGIFWSLSAVFYMGFGVYRIFFPTIADGDLGWEKAWHPGLCIAVLSLIFISAAALFFNEAANERRYFQNSVQKG